MREVAISLPCLKSSILQCSRFQAVLKIKSFEASTDMTESLVEEVANDHL